MPPTRDQPRPLLEHLDELRRCLIQMLLAWAVCTVVVIPFCPAILNVLSRPLMEAGAQPGVMLRAIRFGSGIRVMMQMTLWGGLGLSLPVMIGILARFVFPGLTVVERRMVRRLTLFAGLLFVLGVFLGYRLTLQLAVRFFLRVNVWLGAEMDWVELSDYVTFALKLLLTFGLAFELPMLLLGLGYAGLVHSDSLRRHRRAVVVGTFAAGMLLTPPDPMSQFLLAMPLLVLYELCILLIRLRERAVDARRAA